MERLENAVSVSGKKKEIGTPGYQSRLAGFEKWELVRGWVVDEL